MKTNNKSNNKAFPPQRDPSLIAKENLFKAIKAKKENNRFTHLNNNGTKK